MPQVPMLPLFLNQAAERDALAERRAVKPPADAGAAGELEESYRLIDGAVQVRGEKISRTFEVAEVRAGLNCRDAFGSL